jgi:hypothetical protein
MKLVPTMEVKFLMILQGPSTLSSWPGEEAGDTEMTAVVHRAQLMPCSSALAMAVSMTL